MNIRIGVKTLDEARKVTSMLAQPEHRLIGTGHAPDCAAARGEPCDCKRPVTFWLVREDGGRR